MELFAFPDQVGAENFRQACALADAAVASGVGEGGSLDEDVLTGLQRSSFLTRVLFYVALRAKRRHEGAFTRGSEEWGAAYAEEADRLAADIDLLMEWRKQIEDGHESGKYMATYVSHYSRACTVSPTRLHELAKGRRGMEVATTDVRELHPRSVDVIVADPPYGFNTEQEGKALATLYHDVISVLVGAVRDDGQLIICLPQRSHTGRRLPVCTRSSLVTSQIIAEADRQGREVVVSGRILPKMPRVFSPPYYWESEKALRRAILHFRIRDHRRPAKQSDRRGDETDKRVA